VLARVRNLLGRREATLHQHQTAMVEARLAEQEKVAATLQGVVDRLTVMNTELDRFAFVAAHDLREPLRSVINFSQVLGRQCGDRLGPEEQRSLRHIIDGAKRMYDLVGGLLEYSRVSANMGLPRRGSSACACAMAIENLAAIIEETDAVVTVAEDLPEIGIDEPPLVRVFQNLIGNALKFRHPDRRPQVAVTARLECQAAVFSITDNGIGFEPGEQDVFELFRQLHRHEGFGGAGVGLAISKRIIQGLGGRIWVESEHGQGSTFTFTLPAPPRR